MKNLSLSIKLNKSIVKINVSNELCEPVKQILFSAIITENNRLFPDPDFELYSKNEEYFITGKEINIQKFKIIETLLYNLEWQIVDFLIEGQSELLQLHAASLSYNNEGYLFIGNPGAGKTSISILLLSKGFSFLSDEVGLLSLQKRLFPFPRNLIIKPHLKNIVNIPLNSYELNIERDIEGNELANFISPLYFGRIENQKSVPLKKIFFLDLIENSEYNIERIGQYSSFNKSIPQLFNPQLFNDIPEKIISIISESSCYKLNIGKPLLFSQKQGDDFIKSIINFS